MSPYGIDKSLGGDNPSNDKWMESCVQKVMKSGKDKGSAIGICKATFEKMRGDTSKAEFVISSLLDKNKK